MTGDLSPLEAIVIVLAVYRLTLLVVADELTRPVRESVIGWLNRRKHGPRPDWSMPGYDGPAGVAALAIDQHGWDQSVALRPHRLAVLLECPWCASPYVAAVIVPWAVYGDPARIWWAIMAVAAASGATGYLATKASP